MTTITLVYDFKVNQENFDNLLEMAAYIDGLGQFIDEWDWDTSYIGIRNITGKLNIKFIEDDKQYSVTVHDVEQAVKRIIETRDDVGLHVSNREIVQRLVSTDDWSLCDSDVARWVIEVACFGECIYG
mgnify:FL=1